MADAFVPLPVKTATAGDVVVAIDQTTPGTTNLVAVSSIGAGNNTIGAVFIRNPLDSANMGDVTNPVRIDPVGVTVQPVSTTGTDVVNVGVLAPLPVAFGQPVAVTTLGTDTVAISGNVGVTGEVPVSFGQPIAVTTLGTDVVNIAAANPVPVSFGQPIAVTTLGTDVVKAEVTNTVPVSFGQPIAVETLGTSTVAVSGNVGITGEVPVTFGQPIAVTTLGTDAVSVNVQNTVPVSFGQPIAVETLGTSTVAVTGNVNASINQPVAVTTLGTDVVNVAGVVTMPQPVAIHTTGTDTVNIIATSPLYVTTSNPNEKWSYAATPNIAPAASYYVDSSFITTGKTGELNQIMVASSLPVRAELQMLDAGGTQTTAVGFTSAAWPTLTWPFPDNAYNMVGYGTNAWRVRVTNMDNNKTASAYVSWIYGEL